MQRLVQLAQTGKQRLVRLRAGYHFARAQGRHIRAAPINAHGWPLMLGRFRLRNFYCDGYNPSLCGAAYRGIENFPFETQLLVHPNPTQVRNADTITINIEVVITDLKAIMNAFLFLGRVRCLTIEEIFESGSQVH